MKKSLLAYIQGGKPLIVEEAVISPQHLAIDQTRCRAKNVHCLVDLQEEVES